MNIMKLTGLAVAGVMLAACQSDSYKIAGECSDMNDGDTIFITNDFATGKPFANGIVKDGRFSVEGTIDTPTLCIAYSKSGLSTTFFVEPGTIDIKLINTAKAKVGGTPMNDKWQTVMDSTRLVGTEMDRIGQFLYSSQGTISPEEKAEAMARIEKLQGRFAAFIKRYAEENISNQFGMFMLLYYQELFSPEDLLSLAGKLPAELQNTPDMQKLMAETKHKTQANASGKLPDMTINDIDGKAVRLYDEIAKHDITLIDFWASWCGPCRAEMPNVVALYDECKSKGFGVIGISLDEDKDKWQSAVKSLNMTWLQLSDLKGWHNALAVAMEVRAIPHTVIVDSKGNILANGYRGDRLREFVLSNLE